jgi:hypothetical protein
MIFSSKSVSLWDNVEKYFTSPQATDDNIIRCMRIACEIPRATNTHSECVTLSAFPRQQYLKESVPVLPYTCISSLTALVPTSLDTREQQAPSNNSEEGKNV